MTAPATSPGAKPNPSPIAIKAIPMVAMEVNEVPNVMDTIPVISATSDKIGKVQ